MQNDPIIIIITPPPPPPPGGLVEAVNDSPYAEARALLDQAEAEGSRVRIVKDA